MLKIFNGRNNKKHLLLTGLVFALVGSIYLATTYAFNGDNTNRNERAVVPFEEVPERGLIWADLKADPQAKICDGNLLAVVDRRGGVQGCTHGPDPAPEDFEITEQTSDERLLNTVSSLRDELASSVTETGLNSQNIQCIDDGVSGSRVEVIYAVASDKLDRYETVKDFIPAYAANVERIYTQSAIVHGAEDADVRFVTSGNTTSDCALVVNKVQLSPTGDDSFGNTISEVKAAGFSLANRKYLMFVDTSAYCGVATIYSDSKATQDNYNNGRFPMYARVDSGCWGRSTSVEAHELMHNLGAVQQTAPNPTPGYHCTDDYDRMCYRDSSTVTMQYLCPAEFEERFDCNGDDYFNPNPAPGTYLSANWNSANSAFLEVTLGGGTTPDTEPPQIALVSPSAEAVLSGTTDIAVTATDNKAVSKVEFLIDDAIVATDTSAPYNYSWDTTTATNSNHTISARATDTSGLTAQTTPITVSVDNSAPVDTEPPVVSITSPADGDTLPQRFVVEVSATDNVAVTEVKLQVNGTVIGSDTEAPYEFSMSLSNNVYTIYALASDGIQVGTSAPITIEVSDGPPPDTEAPTAPTNLTAQAVAYNRVDLRWDASSDNVGVSSYSIRRGTTTIATVVGTDYTDSSVLPNTSYNYSVVALDAAGNVSPASNTATATTPNEPDTEAPSAPTNATATAVSSSQINISWTRSVDNVGVSNYRIFRNGTQIATVTGTSFGDTGLQPGTTYTYYIQAVDAAGNVSQNSNQASATTDTIISDSVAPSAPTDLVIVKDRGKNTDLAWGASTDNVGVSGYYVYRKEASASGFVRIGTSPNVNFTDTNAAPKFTWQYYVRAFDAAGNLSANSNTVSNK